MRISTNMLFDLGVASIQQQTSDVIKSQQQIASGRRILSPSDDPVAAARVLEVTQSQSLNKQFDSNTGTVTSKLGLTDSILNSIGNLIQNAQTTAVYAGNATLANGDRASLARELRSNYQELLSLANSTDGGGQYMFSGYRGDTRPFGETAPGVVTYSGDEGQRLIQISPSRQIPVSDSGASVFQQIKNGNGTFVSRAETTNAGTGIVDPGTVSDHAKWVASSKDYTLRFAANTNVTAGNANTGTATLKAGVVDQTAWHAGGESLLVSFAGGPIQGNTVGSVAAGLTITSGTNDQLDITVDGVNATVTIPAGAPYASADALATAVETAINGNAIISGAGKSVAVSQIGGVLTLTSTSLGAGSTVVAAVASVNDAAATLFGGVPTPTAGAPFSYTITGASGASTAGSYTPGATPLTLNFAGTDIILNGVPVVGDNFTVSPSGTSGWTYDIIDNKTNTSVLTTGVSGWSSSWRTYTSGQLISLTNQGTEPVFDFGVSTNIAGKPAAGDTFTIKASQNQDLFATLHNLITALEAGISNPVTTARYQNDLNLAMTSLSNSQTNVLTVRAAVGARMKEVDSVKTTGEDLQLQYQQTISNLQDLDYAKAQTDLLRQKATLEAAQMSFVKVQGMSLFNYM